MTLQQKRGEVVTRRVRSLSHDADFNSSWDEELHRLLYDGVRGIEEWSEEELDIYLNTHGVDGQTIEENDAAG